MGERGRLGEVNDCVGKLAGECKNRVSLVTFSLACARVRSFSVTQQRKQPSMHQQEAHPGVSRSWRGTARGVNKIRKQDEDGEELQISKITNAMI